MDAFTKECPRCSKMKAAASPQPPKERPTPPPTRRVTVRCQICGKELPANATDCPECAAVSKMQQTHPSAPVTAYHALPHPPPPGTPAGLRVLIPIAIALVLLLGAGAYWYLFYGRKGVLHGEMFVVTRGRENIKLGLVSVGVYPLSTIITHIEKRKATAQQETATRQARIDAARSEMQQRKSELDARTGEMNAAREASLAVSPSNYPDFDTYLAASEQADQRWQQTTDVRDQAQQAYNSAETAYESLLSEADQFTSGDFYFTGLSKPLIVVKTNADGQFDVPLPIRGQYVLCAQTQREVFDETEEYYWLVKVSMHGKSRQSIFLSNDNMTDSGSVDSLIETD